MEEHNGMCSLNMFEHTLSGLQAFVNASWERYCRGLPREASQGPPQLTVFEPSIKRWKKVRDYSLDLLGPRLFKVI